MAFSTVHLAHCLKELFFVLLDKETRLLVHFFFLFFFFSLSLFNADPTYYDVLCVSQTSSAEEIKASYRKLVLKCHPDKVAGKEVRCSIATLLAVPLSLVSCWNLTSTEGYACRVALFSISWPERI